MTGAPSPETMFSMLLAVIARLDRLDGGAEQQLVRPDPLGRLREACVRLGIEIAWDDSVDTAGAAALLGLSPGTLKNDRSYGRCPIDSFKQGGRVRYRLEVVARRLDQNQS